MPFDPNKFAAGAAAGPGPKKEEEKQEKPAGFDPNAFASPGAGGAQRPTYQPNMEDLATTGLLGAGGAAATAYGFSGPAITPSAAWRVTGDPVLRATGQTVRDYVTDPLRGVPLPSAAAAQTVKAALPEMRDALIRELNTLPKGADVEAKKFISSLNPQDLDRLHSDVQQRGLDRAIKDFKAPDYLKDDARRALSATQKAFPSGMSMLGRGLNMVGRTAARFAGPVGVGMAAYDVYQLGQFASDQFRNRQQPPSQPFNPPGLAPQPPAQQYINLDQQIREEAARRALGTRQ